MLLIQFQIIGNHAGFRATSPHVASGHDVLTRAKLFPAKRANSRLLCSAANTGPAFLNDNLLIFYKKWIGLLENLDMSNFLGVVPPQAATRGGHP